MDDILTPAGRSARMALIRGKDTKPELTVRRLLHRLGYRFRLHRRDLPGRPDLTFPGRRKVIYVHGCFWHHHSGCKAGHLPSSRQEYWGPKFQRNVERDAKNLNEIAILGWQPFVVWECQTRNGHALAASLSAFLGPPGKGKNKPGATTRSDS